MSAAGQRETARALAAYQQYLMLPPPRRVEELVGKAPVGKNGKKGIPFKLSTLRQWRWIFKWEDRAEAHDREVATAEERKLREWKEQEAERRLRERLDTHQIRRVIGANYLTKKGEGGQQTVRGLEEMDPRRAELANTLIRNAGEEERLDLGAPTQRIGHVGADGGPIQAQVSVADEETLRELRDLLHSMKFVTPGEQKLRSMLADSEPDDVIEGEVIHADD